MHVFYMHQPLMANVPPNQHFEIGLENKGNDP
jgi:hypothetical protein